MNEEFPDERTLVGGLRGNRGRTVEMPPRSEYASFPEFDIRKDAVCVLRLGGPKHKDYEVCISVPCNRVPKHMHSRLGEEVLEEEISDYAGQGYTTRYISPNREELPHESKHLAEHFLFVRDFRQDASAALESFSHLKDQGFASCQIVLPHDLQFVLRPGRDANRALRVGEDEWTPTHYDLIGVYLPNKMERDAFPQEAQEKMQGTVLAALRRHVHKEFELCEDRGHPAVGMRFQAADLGGMFGAVEKLQGLGLCVNTVAAGHMMAEHEKENSESPQVTTQR